MSGPLAVALAVAPKAAAVLVAAIFCDSLRYKFSDHPKTQEIFGRLDAWAGRGGFPGLFDRTGVFGQYMIGGAELLASVLLVAGAFYAPYRFVLPAGALLGAGVMTGAISFHLFTPLGIDPNRDGGGLFRAACLAWLLSVSLLVLRMGDTMLLAQRVSSFLAPA